MWIYLANAFLAYLDNVRNMSYITNRILMGFRDAKSRVLECLSTGHVLHEERNSIDIKNLFATGLVSLDEAALIIGRSKGDGYFSAPHHFDNKIDVHVIKTIFSGQKWYIKWYFLDSDSVFISFHH